MASSAVEEYLQAIYTLADEGGHVVSARLAGFLGFSAAILLLIVAFELPKILQARRHHSEYAGVIRSLPAGLLTAFACAAGC